MKTPFKHKFEGDIDTDDCELCGFKIFAPWHLDGYRDVWRIYGEAKSIGRRRLVEKARSNMKRALNRN